MRIIGITGGVGAGKSEVLRYFRESCGAAVYEADKVAHGLQQPGGACYREIAEHFGSGILAADGTIDRKKLGAVVFQDAEELAFLNRLIHPEVKKFLKAAVEEEKQKKTALLVIEAALLIEEHYEEICDELWYIHTEREERIRRLMQARGYTRKRCEEIMQNQQPEEVFFQSCSRVIDNSGSFADTKRQITEQMKAEQMKSK